MPKIKLTGLILVFCLLAGCAPVQITTPAPTVLPTATVNPCSDRGWADIATYLKQFDDQMENLAVGTSIQVYLDSLKNYQNKINDVDIDACTEHARQSIIAGMGNQITGMEIAITTLKPEDAAPILAQGMTMISDARTELASLDIVFDYP